MVAGSADAGRRELNGEHLDSSVAHARLEYLIAGLALSGFAVAWQAGRGERANTLPLEVQGARVLVSSAAPRPLGGHAEYRREPD
jgi:hypothetical protein